MYAFGLECLETGRFDTTVPLYFFDILRRISEDLDWATTIWDKPGTYEHLKSMFAGYAKAAPSSRKPWYLSCQAACEWHFAHYEHARRLLEELGDQVDTTVFPTFFKRPFGRARGEIYAFTSPAGADIRRAEKLVGSGHFDSALALLRKQTSTPSLHPLAAVYLEQRIASVTFLQDFQAGKWVNLQPDPDFSGWIKEEGEWVIDPDGAIKGTSTQDGLWLLCDTDSGTRLEYRGEMELVASPRQYVPNCGVIFACTGSMEWDFLVFLASKQEQQTMLSHNLWDEETVYGKPQVSGRDTFHIKVWDDTVITYLNGRLVNKNFPTGKEGYDGRVAVGVGSSCDGPGVITRFRNLQLRRLTSRPDPSPAP
jgi:hypothetical protein